MRSVARRTSAIGAQRSCRPASTVEMCHSEVSNCKVARVTQSPRRREPVWRAVSPGPSALVVFALITNLNSLGSSNGRSSGFRVYLRMRSTRAATRSKLRHRLDRRTLGRRRVRGSEEVLIVEHGYPVRGGEVIKFGARSRLSAPRQSPRLHPACCGRLPRKHDRCHRARARRNGSVAIPSVRAAASDVW